jgi:tetratricopeptide (TPR) repeat protein
MRLKAVILAALLFTSPVLAQTKQPKQTPNKPTAASPAQKTPIKSVSEQEKPSDPQIKIDPSQKTAAYLEFLQAQQSEAENNFVKAVEQYKKVIQLDPSQPEPHVALGNLYLQNRNLRDAENSARQALKISKDSIGGHRLLGRILANEGLSGAGNKEKLQEAVIEFLEVVRLDKNDAEGWKFLSALYSSLNDNDSALKAYQNLISTGLATFADYFEMARIHYSKNQYREAAQAARQAFEQSDNSPQAGFLLADSLLRSGQTSEAIEIYQTALKETPNSVGLTFGLCEALVRAGRYDDATQILNKVLESDPKNLRALNLLAQVQRQGGKRQEAIETLKRALQGQDVSESLDVQFELAETYQELGETEKAVAAFEEALAALSDPDGTVSESNKRNASIVMRAILNVYRNSGQKDKALQVIEKMRKAFGNTSTIPDETLISLYSTEGKYKEAFDAAVKARKQFPKERNLAFLEAQVLSQLHKVDEAMAVLQNLFTGTDEDADVYHSMAFVMMENRRFDSAEENIQKCLRYDEKNINYLVTLSSIYDRAKRYAESETVLRKVLSIDPNNATALNNLGYFLTERNERLEEALEFIKRAVSIEPANGSFLDSLGWIYFKLGKLDLAQKYLEESALYDRRSADVQEHLGDLYYKLGRLDDARKHWQKAIEFSISEEDIARLKTKLSDPKSSISTK